MLATLSMKLYPTLLDFLYISSIVLQHLFPIVCFERTTMHVSTKYGPIFLSPDAPTQQATIAASKPSQVIITHYF